MADAILHEEYRDKLLKLTEEEQLAVFWAMMDYAAGKEVAPMEGLADMAFAFIADRIDTDAVKYSNKVRAGKRSGASRRENTEEKAEPEQNETCSNKENSVRTENNVFEHDENCSGISISNSISKSISISNAKEKESKEKAPSGAARFVKPTIDDVRKYCIEKNYLLVKPEKFISYYESNGWKVGKNPMKNWKAAVQNWNTREKEEADQKDGKPRNAFHNFEQRKTDLNAILEAQTWKQYYAEQEAAKKGAVT